MVTHINDAGHLFARTSAVKTAHDRATAGCVAAVKHREMGSQQIWSAIIKKREQKWTKNLKKTE